MKTSHAFLIACFYPVCRCTTAPGPRMAKQYAKDAGFTEHATFGTLYWVCPAHTGCG